MLGWSAATSRWLSTYTQRNSKSLDFESCDEYAPQGQGPLVSLDSKLANIPVAQGTNLNSACKGIDKAKRSHSATGLTELPKLSKQAFWMARGIQEHLRQKQTAQTITQINVQTKPQNSSFDKQMTHMKNPPPHKHRQTLRLLTFLAWKYVVLLEKLYDRITQATTKLVRDESLEKSPWTEWFSGRSWSRVVDPCSSYTIFDID